jgi:hypothetical protein
MSKAHKVPGDRAPVSPEVAGAAWRRLPWGARLLLLLHRSWPRLTRLPLLRRWLAWAVVRFITEVGSAKARRRAGDLPDEVFVESRGDRLIRRLILVMGIAAIIVRHLGRLVLALGALAFLTPFLLWPPCWPELRTAYDAARREAEEEDDRDEEG